jgi:hypothetical protein
MSLGVWIQDLGFRVSMRVRDGVLDVVEIFLTLAL